MRKETKLDKFVEKESRLIFFRDMEMVGIGDALVWKRFLFLVRENVLEADSGDAYKTFWTYFGWYSLLFKMVSLENFIYIYSQYVFQCLCKWKKSINSWFSLNWIPGPSFTNYKPMSNLLLLNHISITYVTEGQSITRYLLNKKLWSGIKDEIRNKSSTYSSSTRCWQSRKRNRYESWS